MDEGFSALPWGRLSFPRLIPHQLLGDSELVPPGWMDEERSWSPHGDPLEMPEGFVCPGNTPAILMGSTSKAAVGARRVGKALFPLLGRVIHECRLWDFRSLSWRARLLWGWMSGGDLCPQRREAVRAQHQPWAPFPAAFGSALGLRGGEEKKNL